MATKPSSRRNGTLQQPARDFSALGAFFCNFCDFDLPLNTVNFARQYLAAITALSALAQTTRLDTFRLLVSREPEGVAAGELARVIAIPQNTMSTHLAILARAGLVRGKRRSRTILYRADLQRFREVALYLLKDCCGARPEVCAPLIADLADCCSPRETA
jgi:ArsR family transcriptional regulator